MKTKILILALVLALSSLAGGVALANGPQPPRQVLSGGATDSAATGVSLRATLGQPFVGLVTGSGGDITVGQGFWHGGIAGYEVYLPVVIRSN